MSGITVLYLERMNQILTHTSSVCFQYIQSGLANTGAIVVLGDVEFTIGYVYDKSKDNFNDRSIEGMSRNTYKKMRACGNCPFYKDFKKFEHYYGSATYANKYILAAFKGWFANFTHGDANFSNYDFDARAGTYASTLLIFTGPHTHISLIFCILVITAAIQTATSFLTITQYTLQELEHSINNCEHAECREVHCLRNAIQSMEAGVAYYTGSLEGSDGTGKGYLLYALADEMCKIFKTCGPKGDKINGPSKVNIEIFEQFRLMQDNIRNHQCTPARKNKDRIAILMTIPLVQATLQQAFIGGRQAGASLVDEARGAAFAASVVPIVGQCKILDGEVIYDNMKTSKGYQTDFEEVKLAFESNYECMGLTCADVGGYWFNGITGGFYMDGFLPCGLEPPEPWTPGQVIGFVVASFAGAAFLYGVFTTCRYFYFFGMCKTLQKRARRKTPVTVRSNRGVQA